MKKILFVLLMGLLFSCKSKETILDYTNSRYDISSLFRQININEDSLSSPEFVLSMGDYIIIGDNSKENILVAYNIKDTTSKVLLLKGNGAGEILKICYLNKSGNDSEFYVYDDFKKTIIYFNIHNNNIDIHKWEKMTDYSSFILSKDYIIGSRHKSNYRYTISNRNDYIQYEIGNYSEFDISVQLGSEVLYGFITNNHRNKRFAWVPFYAESINIIDYGEGLKEIINNVYKYPKYTKYRENKMEIPVFSSSNTIGFTAICSSDNSIFALYNGNALKDAMKNPQNDILLCNNICVFNWEGDIKFYLTSDKPIKSIDYDEKKDKIIFIVLSEKYTYQIMEIDLFNINAIIKS